MKIAINIEAVGARRGGAEKYAGALIRWLDQCGHDVHLFAREVDAGEVPSDVKIHLLRPLVPPGCGWLRTYLFGRASERVLASQDFDLIVGLVKVWYQHVYVAVGGAHPASLDCSSRRFRSPWHQAIWWASKFCSPKQWVFRWISRRQFGGQHQPHIIAPAQMVADHFQHYHGVAPERIDVVPNALDVDAELGDPAAARAAFREQQNLRSDQIAILFAGRNYALKGLDPLMESFAAVAPKYPQARLLVCGSDRDRVYRRMAARLGVAGQVRFLGLVEDVRPCYAGSDVFAFPSFYDPCSLAALEAMHYGLPVITSRQNGASELISDGINGFVIDSPWATPALSQRLEQLIENEQLRWRLGQQARLAAENFSFAKRAPALIEALNHAATDPLASPQMRHAA